MKQLAMIGLAAFASVTSCGAFAAARTEPANFYVSEKGDWDPDGAGRTYTTIMGAIADATIAGDTVWVKDGYVCSGELALKNWNGANTMIYLDKAITLRSESGYVDETKGKGATLRGPGRTLSGADADNCLRVLGVNAAATVFGFVIENGVSRTPSYEDWWGGANVRILCDGMVSNCVVRGGYARAGGGVFIQNGFVSHSVITNNLALSAGGGIYGNTVEGIRLRDTLVANNYAGYNGGGVFGVVDCFDCDFIANAANAGAGGGYAMQTHKNFHPTISNCLFKANTAGQNGSYSGGGGLSTSMYTGDSDDTADVFNCRFYDNVAGEAGGAARGANYYKDCTFIGNMVTNMSSSGRGGAVFGMGDGFSNDNLLSPPTKPAVLDHCTIVSNVAQSGSMHGGGIGGGVHNCLATNGTLIAYNVAKSCGGGAYGSILVDCEIFGNVCTNMVEGHDWGYNGGAGAGDCWVTNCLVANNVLTPTRCVSDGPRGGGTFNCHVVGCVISNNLAKSNGGGYFANRAFACVNNKIVNNVCYARGGGLYAKHADFVAYNCLVADNAMSDTGDNCGAGGICGEWTGSAASDKVITLCNCTVTGNDAPGSPGGVTMARILNTIAYGNFGPKNGEGTYTARNGTIYAATNCCYDAAQVAVESGRVTGDPKLVQSGAKHGYLHASSPCRGTGFYDKDDPAFAWMTDSDDPRSKALNGLPRVTDGKVDVGAFGYTGLSGFSLLIR